VNAPVARPGGTTTPATAPYWTAAADGRLLIQRCGGCGHLQHYPRTLCARCWSAELDLIAAAGTGTVWTYTIVHHPGHPAWNTEVPYVLALVELDEGPRLMTNIVDVPVDQVHVGQRVTLTPPDAAADPPVLAFTPSAEEPA